MKSADRAAGDGDKGEGKDGSGKHGPAAVGKARQGRHVQGRAERDDADCQQRDCAEFYERAQVVAGREQQPHGQRRCGESVDDDENRQRGSGQREDCRPGRRLGNPPSPEDGGEHEHKSEDGSFENFSGADAAQIDAHQYGDGHGHGDGERSPWARLERVDDDERGGAEQDDDDAEHGDVGDNATQRADFGFCHLRKRFAVAANGEQQDDEILHATTQYSAGYDPECAGQVSELCGEHGADQRAGAGDGGEVVSENDPLVGGNEVAAVVETLGGRGAQGIERQHFGRNETAVEAISDGVGGNGGDDQPEGVDLLAAMQCDGGQRQRSEEADGNPEKNAQEFWHEGYGLAKSVRRVLWRKNAGFASAPSKSTSLPQGAQRNTG